jgi:hypothetical protein
MIEDDESPADRAKGQEQESDDDCDREEEPETKTAPARITETENADGEFEQRGAKREWKSEFVRDGDMRLGSDEDDGDVSHDRQDDTGDDTPKERGRIRVLQTRVLDGFLRR